MELLEQISENLQKGRAKAVKERGAAGRGPGPVPGADFGRGAAVRHERGGGEVQEERGLRPRGAGGRPGHEHGHPGPKAPAGAGGGVQATGRVCIGTVKGDLHDIGINLVKMMMEGKGLEVIDLGTDVPPETFVKTAVEQHCQIICCSALLTTTMGVMGEVVKLAQEAGIRDQVKIMVGGRPRSPRASPLRLARTSTPPTPPAPPTPPWPSARPWPEEAPMQRNMKQWLEDLVRSPEKKPLPILSFPAVQLLGDHGGGADRRQRRPGPGLGPGGPRGGCRRQRQPDGPFCGGGVLRRPDPGCPPGRCPQWWAGWSPL